MREGGKGTGERGEGERKERGGNGEGVNVISTSHNQSHMCSL